MFLKDLIHIISFSFSKCLFQSSTAEWDSVFPLVRCKCQFQFGPIENFYNHFTLFRKFSAHISLYIFRFWIQNSW